MDGQDPKLPQPLPKDAYEEAEEKVGYGRPPVATQFKPGKSGNPDGRPPGSRNKLSRLAVEKLDRNFWDEMHREIQVMDGGRRVKMTMKEAITRSLATKAVKGDFRSQKFALVRLAEIARRTSEEEHRLFDSAVQLKEEKLAELKRRMAAGEKHPEVYPHPDDIYVDYNGNIDIVGPLSVEQKEYWKIFDWVLMTELDLIEEIKDLIEDLAKSDLSDDDSEMLRKRLEEARAEKNRIEAKTALIPDEKKARRQRRLLAKLRTNEPLW